jgi:hypothetical protein
VPCTRPGRRGPDARASGLRDLHLRHHRAPEGRDGRTPYPGQLRGRRVAPVRDRARRHGAAAELAQLRHLGRGDLPGAVRGCRDRTVHARVRYRRRGRGRVADGRAHHRRALAHAGEPVAAHAGEGAARAAQPAPVQRDRRRAVDPEAAGLGRIASSRAEAGQHLRPDRNHRVVHRGLRALRRVERIDGGRDHRSPAREHEHLHPGCAPAAGAPRRRRRDLHRRRWRRPRLSESGRADGRALRARSVQRGSRGADVQERRSCALSRRRQHRVPGPQRLPGEDPRLPRRVARACARRC